MADSRRGPGRGSGARPGGGSGARRPAASSPSRRGARSPSGNGQKSRSPDAGAARASATKTAKPQRRPAEPPRSRASVTSRVALLALVLVVLLVSYAYPLRSWYEQRAERNELEREAEELRESVGELETELELWDDPAYIAAQARERLGYVMPGEEGFIVIPPEESEGSAAEGSPDDVAVSDQDTWYERLWGSVEAADAPVPEADR